MSTRLFNSQYLQEALFRIRWAMGLCRVSPCSVSGQPYTGRPVDNGLMEGGLLCLGSLEERESWATMLVFLISTFPFSQATQTDKSPFCGPLSTGRPGMRPNSQTF